MKCPKCDSETAIPVFVGIWCFDCSALIPVDSMKKNFLNSLVERYSDNPSKNNRPGKDGYIEEDGSIEK